MLIGNHFNSPTFLKAKTPEDLRKAMLQNNVKNHTEFHYFDIQFVPGKGRASGFWYAWYKFNFSKKKKEVVG